MKLVISEKVYHVHVFGYYFFLMTKREKEHGINCKEVLVSFIFFR